jgi:hypothetical protein
MPYRIRKVPKKNCYRVTNRITKRVLAKCSTRENAKRQVRLLWMLTSLKNSNHTRFDSSSKKPVTELNGAPQRGANSILQGFKRRTRKMKH